MEVFNIKENCICHILSKLQAGTSLRLILKGSSEAIDFIFLKISHHCVIGLRNGSTAIFDCNCICAILSAPTCTETTTTFSNPDPITIPDLSQAIPYPSNIIVAGLTGPILKVTVTINNFSHTFPDDVGILVVGPGGQNVDLLDCAGGGTDAVNTTVTFDDNASSQVPNSGPLVSGTFQPSAYCNRNFNAPAPSPPFGSQLSVFNGTDPNGTWRLFVQDFVGGDVGVIAGGWTLNITTCEP